MGRSEYGNGAVIQPGKEKASRSAKDNAHGSLFCMVYYYYITFDIYIDSRLPILPFAG